MLGRPRSTLGGEKRQKAQEAWQKYYQVHREERLLKLALRVPNAEAKERKRIAYHRRLDERDALRGVPRRTGRPPATQRQRLETALGRSAAYPEIAELIRLQLAELNGKMDVEENNGLGVQDRGESQS